jgi:hypothetical protein
MLKSSLLSSKEIFGALLEIELKRSLRYQNYLALLLLEARIPNHAGCEPDNGNSWSKLVALVSSVIRETDLVGAPERNLLTIVLLNSDNRVAALVAERLNGWVAQCYGRGNYFSIGGACFPTHATDLKGLYQSASCMLAAARDQGVTCYGKL